MSEPALTLTIGTKNLSSWSLRGWLALKHVGVPFAEQLVQLDQPDSRSKLGALSPSGRVPALRHGDLVIWDSLAIGEYLAETFPEARLWPEHPRTRAIARSAVAEMHSGFADLRKNMPMNIKARLPNQGRTPEVLADIQRILSIWRDCRGRFGTGGPFLFGAFTLADAFYAPVATRFTTYEVDLDPEARAYVEAIWALPAMQEWRAAC